MYLSIYVVTYVFVHCFIIIIYIYMFIYIYIYIQSTYIYIYIYIQSTYSDEQRATAHYEVAYSSVLSAISNVSTLWFPNLLNTLKPKS